MNSDTNVTPPDREHLNPESNALLRQRMLRRFEVWLDEILDGEQPPEGIGAEILDQLRTDSSSPERSGSAPDLYSLWSSVTAMTEETRLQGRSFKQLHEDLTPMQNLVRSVSSTLERYERAMDRQEKENSDSMRNTVLDEILDVLIDIRDRLDLGRDSAEQSLKAVAPSLSGLFSLLGSKKAMMHSREAIAALIKGYELCRERLDEALSRFGVRPIDCIGRPFDPAAMKAVDIDEASEAGDGTVVEIYRPGYWRDESVYRPAEVKVARKR